MSQADLFDGPRTRRDELVARFIEYHRENPQVWELFQRFANQLVASGKKHYSADLILHRIRWHTEVETTGEEIKINDNHTAYYARLYHLKYPERQIFRLRRLNSEDRPASGAGCEHVDGPPADETKLNERLAALLGEDTP